MKSCIDDILDFILLFFFFGGGWGGGGGESGGRMDGQMDIDKNFQETSKQTDTRNGCLKDEAVPDHQLHPGFSFIFRGFFYILIMLNTSTIGTRTTFDGHSWWSKTFYTLSSVYDYLIILFGQKFTTSLLHSPFYRRTSGSTRDVPGKLGCNLS